MDTDDKKSLIEFPCSFPIKVMGSTHPEFSQHILTAVQEHAPDTTHENIALKQSSKGNYVSATITVRVNDQEQLDNIYRTVHAHPMVKLVF